MSYIPDLAPVSYNKLKGPIRAVGWLESPHPFPRGPVDPEFGQRLLALIERPLGAFFTWGMYWCSFCAAEGKVGPDFRSSQGTLLVPASACIYETPIWIGHYVLAHSYQPPAEFCHAVQSCPDPGSGAFLDALIAHVPQLNSIRDEMGPPYFAELDAQFTLQPCPINGSEDQWQAAHQSPSDKRKAYMKRLWRSLWIALAP